jgi:hypothetical protein
MRALQLEFPKCGVCVDFHREGGIYRSEWDLHRLGEVGLAPGGGRPAGVTPSFKAKTECIPFFVPGSNFTHKVINSEINSITSVYYIISYYKNLLQVQDGLSSGKDTILP